MIEEGPDYNGIESPKAVFNYNPDIEGSFHCGAAENMLMESINRGMHMSVKLDGFEGIMKFAGSLAILCTKADDSQLINKWLTPIEDRSSQYGPQFRLTNSILANNSVDLNEIFSGINWRASRVTRWSEIPAEIQFLIDQSEDGLTPFRDGVVDELEYLQWQQDATAAGYIAYASEKTGL